MDGQPGCRESPLRRSCLDGVSGTDDSRQPRSAQRAVVDLKHLGIERLAALYFADQIHCTQAL